MYDILLLSHREYEKLLFNARYSNVEINNSLQIKKNTKKQKKGERLCDIEGLFCAHDAQGKV